MAEEDQRVLESEALEQEEHWISLSDIMTGMMLLFMLVAVVYMLRVEAEKEIYVIEKEKFERLAEVHAKEKERVKRVAVLYRELRENLYEELAKEFAADLKRWDAEITPTLVVRFKEPEVLFDQGKSTLKPKFKEILDSFFPRYIRILAGPKYVDNIEEIRIEGHTSSDWVTGGTPDYAYSMNMALSQSRTREVLQYVLFKPEVMQHKPWLIRHLSANGLSSSQLVVDGAGRENAERSRRVEFRVRTKAEERIGTILAVEGT
jgi:outer membrane protein OmpA-like peptidoglycan-associated protein